MPPFVIRYNKPLLPEVLRTLKFGGAPVNARVRPVTQDVVLFRPSAGPAAVPLGANKAPARGAAKFRFGCPTAILREIFKEIAVRAPVATPPRSIAASAAPVPPLDARRGSAPYNARGVAVLPCPSFFPGKEKEIAAGAVNI